MKKSYLVIVGTFIIVAVAAVFWSKPKTDISPRQETPRPSSASYGKNFEKQTNSEGGVTVEITPQSVSEGAFLVILSTHSVELTDDLAKITVLNDENGREYRPINWEGAPPGGHHREGVLKFGPLSPTPQKIELVISGIGGIPERRFLWTILP